MEAHYPILVQVEGPELLAQSLCALLNGFPHLKATTQGSRYRFAEKLPLPDDTVPLWIVGESQPDGTRAGFFPDDAYPFAPTGSFASPPYSGGRVDRSAVLILGCAENALHQAAACGVRVFLSVHDNLATLSQGVEAAAIGAPFCSPVLTPYLIAAFDRDRPAAPHQTRYSDRLSRREAEVALLAAEGLSNEEIARRLFIESTTVKAHLGVVFRKLAIKRRSQLGKVVFAAGNSTKVVA